MHHVHISTGALFVLFLILCALIAGLVCLVAFLLDIRAARSARDAPQGTADARSGGRGYPSASAPAYVAPAIVNVGNPNDGLLTGVLIGEALARPDVIVEQPIYVPPEAPSCDGIDISWGDSSSGSSGFDSGSCGGGDSGGGVSFDF